MTTNKTIPEPLLLDEEDYERPFTEEELRDIEIEDKQLFSVWFADAAGSLAVARLLTHREISVACYPLDLEFVCWRIARLRGYSRIKVLGRGNVVYFEGVPRPVICGNHTIIGGGHDENYAELRRQIPYRIVHNEHTLKYMFR